MSRLPTCLVALTSLALALAVAPLTAQPAPAPAGPALEGKIQGRTYVSPTGMFKITIPVLPELGGEVTDTPNVVTFSDDFSVHVSIAAFPQDRTQKWEFETRGHKDYLTYFFENFVAGNFGQVQLQREVFEAAVQGGAVINYILIPGGTMFADRIPQLGVTERIPIAKRGNLLFIRNGHVFVISIELAERVIEGSAYKKTVAEEDQLLRTRLLEMMGRMTFTKLPEPAQEAAKK